LVGRAVHDAVELVFHHNFVVEFHLALLHLAKELDQDRYFHGAGGVEDLVGSHRPFGLAIERLEIHGNVGAGGSDSLLDGHLGGGELLVLSQRGRASYERSYKKSCIECEVDSPRVASVDLHGAELCTTPSGKAIRPIWLLRAGCDFSGRYVKPAHLN